MEWETGPRFESRPAEWWQWHEVKHSQGFALLITLFMIDLEEEEQFNFRMKGRKKVSWEMSLLINV